MFRKLENPREQTEWRSSSCLIPMFSEQREWADHQEACCSFLLQGDTSHIKGFSDFIPP